MIFGMFRGSSTDEFARIIFPEDFEFNSSVCVLEGNQYQQTPEIWKMLIWVLYYVKTLQTLGAGPHADGLKEMLELWAYASIDDAKRGFPNGSNSIDPEFNLTQHEPNRGEEYTITVNVNQSPPTIYTTLAKGGHANRLAYSVVALAEYISIPRAPKELPASVIHVQEFHAAQQHYSKLSSIKKSYDHVLSHINWAVADSSVPKVVVTCPKCYQKHNLPAGKSGTVRCKQCNHKFNAST